VNLICIYIHGQLAAAAASAAKELVAVFLSIDSSVV
jgi:hypothetical protein